MRRWHLFPLFGSLLLLACGSTSGVPTEGEVSDEVTAEAEDALKADGRSTFYFARHDDRRCASPMCGGAWVRRVNYPTTRCSDGTYQAECYVSELRLPADVAEVPTAQALYRGTIGTKTYSGIGRFGVFKATEVWSPDADTVDEPSTSAGTFYRVEASGVVCVRAPCPSLRQGKLNSTARPTSLTVLDLSGAPGTAAQHRAAASEALTSAVLAVGTNILGKDGLQLTATQYYRRVQAAAPVEGKADGDTCADTSECAGGLECCYPCGIQGCVNRCMPPAPGGGCPLFP
ncbi:MAG: hypothetical protein IPQ09_16110 [Myxococcales bacterium]|jgi:hypothetical protein|nr:hypothetical protein [Myxococcales bacterium]HQY61914.1 hypothetical protein [Polyangiaceae bacterium]